MLRVFFARAGWPVVRRKVGEIDEERHELAFDDDDDDDDD